MYSTSLLQRPYGAHEKNASAIRSVMKRFVADIGVPGAFRTDNGTEYTNVMFVEYCQQSRNPARHRRPAHPAAERARR